MKKTLISFALYWHFILDILLTHIYVISHLHAAFYVTASFLMATDSILKVGLSVFFAKIVARYRSTLRYRVSVFIRLSLIVIWVAAISQLPSGNLTLLMLLLYLVFKLLMLIDSSLSSDLIIAVHEKLRIDLTMSSAAQNIIIRASTAFAPAVALILLSAKHLHLIAFLAAIVLGLGSVMLLRNVLFSVTDISASQHKDDVLTLRKLLSNPVMRWGIIFQGVANIAFAGVAFLLLAQLNPYDSVYLNQITVLYTAFLFSQGIVLLFGEAVVPIAKVSEITIVMVLCGLFIFLESLCESSVIKLLFCLGIGVTYSFVLSGVQKVITSMLRGPGFIYYVAWAQTVGRASSFIVTMLLGFVMSAGLSSTVLLAISGLLGMVSAAMLAFIPCRDSRQV